MILRLDRIRTHMSAYRRGVSYDEFIRLGNAGFREVHSNIRMFDGADGPYFYLKVEKGWRGIWCVVREIWKVIEICIRAGIITIRSKLR